MIKDIVANVCSMIAASDKRLQEEEIFSPISFFLPKKIFEWTS